MLSYLEIALVNAILIIPLALIAAATGRLFRRPALTHLLWVVVLVRLMTPPVWQIPLVDHEWLKTNATQFVPRFLSEPDRIIDFDPFDNYLRTTKQPLENEKQSAGSLNRPHSLTAADKKVRVPRNLFLVALRDVIQSPIFPQLMTAGLMAVWATGSLFWFCVQGFRCARFRWLLSKGTRAPKELQQLSLQAGIQLGLTKSPDVWLMPGTMSPMLWGTGQSSLLIFPEQLLDRLDQESTKTLMMHELAHFRRRDHLVRIIALMVTGFFWWHPVVWWARREIEATEEECCDAVVVRAMTAPPKRYAEAILETVDFLAESRLRLPPLATGLGQFPFLRQRLTWIMRGPRRQDLGRAGKILFLILACHLPLQPTWLQSAHLSTSSAKPRIYEPDADISATTAISSGTVLTEQPQVSSRWLGLDVRCQSSDKRFIVLANDSTQILVDLETGRDFDLSPFDITAIAFSPEANLFVTLDGDRFLRLWDADRCDVLQTWQVPGGLPKSVDISIDARWIVTGGHDGIVRIWSSTSQRPVRELPRELSPVNCVRFSPDSDLLAVATGDSASPQTARIVLFDVGRWTERISMNWSSPTAAVAFQAGGSLVSGDWQGRIARWNIETGELMGYTTSASQSLLKAEEFSAKGSPLADIEVPDLLLDFAGEEESPREKSPWYLKQWPLPSSTRSLPIEDFNP